MGVQTIVMQRGLISKVHGKSLTVDPERLHYARLQVGDLERIRIIAQTVSDYVPIRGRPHNNFIVFQLLVSVLEFDKPLIVAVNVPPVQREQPVFVSEDVF